MVVLLAMLWYGAIFTNITKKLGFFRDETLKERKWKLMMLHKCLKEWPFLLLWNRKFFGVYKVQIKSASFFAAIWAPRTGFCVYTLLSSSYEVVHSTTSKPHMCACAILYMYSSSTAHVRASSFSFCTHMYPPQKGQWPEPKKLPKIRLWTVALCYVLATLIGTHSFSLQIFLRLSHGQPKGIFYLATFWLSILNV